LEEVFAVLVGLLADALPWFLGGAILGAALEAFSSSSLPVSFRSTPTGNR
jgi:hypothetical protein